MLHYSIQAYKYKKTFLSAPLALMCCKNLYKCHLEKRVVIYAFCLMPDHLHLCVDGPVPAANQFVGRWKSFVTHQSWKFGWTGKLWRDRFLLKECTGAKAEAEVIGYVLDNPVKAGLVHLWRHWPYWAEPFYGKKGWK